MAIKKKYNQTEYNKTYNAKAKKDGTIYNVGIRLYSGKDGEIIDYLKKCPNKRRFLIEAIYEKMDFEKNISSKGFK